MNFPRVYSQLAGRWDQVSNCAQTQMCISQNNIGNLLGVDYSRHFLKNVFRMPTFIFFLFIYDVVM